MYTVRKSMNKVSSMAARILNTVVARPEATPQRLRSLVHVTPTAPGSGRSLATQAKRDPDRPKKPLTAWLRYLQDYRQTQGNAPQSGLEVMKAAAAEWKKLSETQRAPWVAPYEKEKKVYAGAFQKYKDSGKLDAWKRDPQKPKRPMTAYLRFSQEFRLKAENKSLSAPACMKASGAAWKTLTAERKKPYEEKANADMQTYKKELEKYKASGSEEVWKKKVGLDIVEKKAQEMKEKKKALETAAKEKAKAKLAKQKEKERAIKAKAKAAASKTKAAELKKKAKLKAELEKTRLATKKSGTSKK